MCTYNFTDISCTKKEMKYNIFHTWKLEELVLSLQPQKCNASQHDAEYSIGNRS